MRTVNVLDVLNESKFSKFHYILVFWCAVLIFFDGIELGLIGAISTSVIEEWSLNTVQVGAISSYTSIGMIIGGLLFGPLADKISRKNTILISTFIYSFFTLMGAFSQGITDFSIYRFIAGIGMGGVVPTTLGLISDFTPRKNRSFSLTIATASIGVGGMSAGLIAIFLIPAFGWRSLFIIGALPILALPILIKILPESPVLLIKKQKFAPLSNILNRIVNKETYNAEDNYQLEVQTQSKIPFTALFQNKQAIGTLLLWFTFLCSYLVSFALTAWLPNLMVRAGYPLTSSLLFGVSLGLGALVGTLTGGKIAGRIGLKKVISFSFILGGIALFILSNNVGSAGLLYGIIFIAGWGTTGSQNLLLAFSSQFYPTEIRSTGIASANVLGRVGGFIGPIFAGVILSLNFSISMSFMIFGIVVLIAALSLSVIRITNGNTQINPTVNNTIKQN